MNVNFEMLPEKNQENQTYIESKFNFYKFFVLLFISVFADCDNVKAVFPINKHLPVHKCQRKIVQEHEQVAVEETHKCYERMQVYLIWNPLCTQINQHILLLLQTSSPTIQMAQSNSCQDHHETNTKFVRFVLWHTKQREHEEHPRAATKFSSHKIVCIIILLSQ